jgi:hypothetical protein
MIPTAVRVSAVNLGSARGNEMEQRTNKGEYCGANFSHLDVSVVRPKAGRTMSEMCTYLITKVEKTHGETAENDSEVKP